MEMTIYNPQKGRLESINVTVNEATTTWFDDRPAPDDIYMITDTDNGLLIRENNYSYPVLLYDVTRTDIGNDQQKDHNEDVLAINLGGLTYRAIACWVIKRCHFSRRHRLRKSGNVHKSTLSRIRDQRV